MRNTSPVAGRLRPERAPADTDPYVERLLEGVAFLGARVKLKLQDQFPDFTQHLLNAIQPHLSGADAVDGRRGPGAARRRPRHRNGFQGSAPDRDVGDRP
ncbi:type VI secretion system baseplate subunit TssF [Caulobacter segnis]